MYQFSDIETTDSEDGIRYKTDSTKTKKEDTFQRNSIEFPKNKTVERSKHKSFVESKSCRNYERSQGARRKGPISWSRDRSRTIEGQKHKHSRSKSREHNRRYSSERNVTLKIIDGKEHKDRKSCKHQSSKSLKSNDILEILKNKSRVNSENVNQLPKMFPETIKDCSNKDDNCIDQNILKYTSSLSTGKATFILNEQEEIQSIPRTSERTISRDVAQCAIGPALPPHLKSTSHKNLNHKEVRFKSSDSLPTTSSRSEAHVDTLNFKLLVEYEPPSSLNRDECEFSDINVEFKKIGPELPPHLLKHVHKKSDCNLDIPTDPLRKLPSNLKEIPPQSNVDLEFEAIGPALPPHLLQHIQDENHHNLESFTNKSQKIIGPTLPAHLRTQFEQESTDKFINDDYVYGPLPTGSSSFSAAHVALEERALQMKIDSLQDKDQKMKREEWMIALPEVGVSKIGLGPRQFRKNPVPDMSDRFDI